MTTKAEAGNVSQRVIAMNQQFDISVILCTYNRCALLKKAIDSVLAQDCPGVRYELIVVDNHSSDQTRELCQSRLSQSGVPARYLFEPQQGVSYARNAAIREARAPILAFFDDDVCVSKNWLATIQRAFEEHPGISGVGGKVLPHWGEKVPRWLTREQWAPLALQDYGDQPIRIHTGNPLCLITANLALRREVFDRIGRFSPDLQRVKDGIGSMEDHELHMRLWEAGFEELYLPDLLVTTEVQPERLTREYHRKWHKGHGHFYALLGDPEFETSAARLFDVPAHLYKQALIDLLQWCNHRLRRQDEQAFACETRLCFFAGFFQQRRRVFRQAQTIGTLREIASFCLALLRFNTGNKVRLEKP
jgi:glycosyltransferase involved in cell wall biosynthesis